MPVLECPTCGKSVSVARIADAPFRPFCSSRCKMVDLGRWLDGTYRVSEPLTPEEVDRLPESDELDR
jgi:endogenous inhibitor of DNA gyrase (YacG/DUF329 family)